MNQSLLKVRRAPCHGNAAIAASVLAMVLQVASGTASAAAIFDETGLTAPATTITFDEQVFPSGKVLTYQYSADGVRFAPDLVYGIPVAPGDFPLISGNILRNFFPNGGGPFQGTTPYSIKFEDVQTRAAAAINFVGGNGVATALLNGNPVESFNFSTPPAGGSKYVGFSGIAFNELRIDVPGTTATTLLDNIQLGIASKSIRNKTGLAAPSRVITFDEHVFASGTVLTNQYADLGVRFSPNLVYGIPVTPAQFPPLEGNILRNFFPNGDDEFVGAEPFSLLFDDNQTSVAFALNFLQPGATTISALLDGNLVRSFDVEASINATDNFYLGFSGIVFDEIRVDLPNGNNTILLDNIQFGALAVPAPGVHWLLAIGLLGLFTARRAKPRINISI